MKQIKRGRINGWNRNRKYFDATTKKLKLDSQTEPKFGTYFSKS